MKDRGGCSPDRRPPSSWRSGFGRKARVRPPARPSRPASLSQRRAAPVNASPRGPTRGGRSEGTPQHETRRNGSHGAFSEAPGPAALQCRPFVTQETPCLPRSSSPRRRPDRRDQPEPCRRRARSAPPGRRHRRLRRPPRRARHHQRGLCRPRPGNQPQPRTGCRHARRRAGFHRDKPDAAYCREIFTVLQAHGITHFFYIGGNDSSDTVRIVAEEARRPTTRYAASTSPRPSTTTWSATTTRPASPRLRASSSRPSPAPTSDNAALPGVYVGVVMGPRWLPDRRLGLGQEVPTTART